MPLLQAVVGWLLAQNPLPTLWITHTTFVIPKPYHTTREDLMVADKLLSGGGGGGRVVVSSGSYVVGHWWGLWWTIEGD